MDEATRSVATSEMTHWERRSKELYAAIKRELGGRLDDSKALLAEGASGEVYMGKVIAISESFIAQEIFCNSIFVHLRQDIERLGPIMIGQHLTVRYNAYSVELIDSR